MISLSFFHLYIYSTFFIVTLFLKAVTFHMLPDVATVAAVSYTNNNGEVIHTAAGCVTSTQYRCSLKTNTEK